MEMWASVRDIALREPHRGGDWNKSRLQAGGEVPLYFLTLLGVLSSEIPLK